MREFTVTVPIGKGEILIHALRNHADAVSFRTHPRAGDKVEFSSTTPQNALLRVRLLFPNARVIEKSRGSKVHVHDELPEWVEGIISCPNKNCITAQPKEPTHPKFRIIRLTPLTLQCYYCGRYIDYNSFVSQLA